jgi:farnesyl diphosphate synthase
MPPYESASTATGSRCCKFALCATSIDQDSRVTARISRNRRGKTHGNDRGRPSESKNHGGSALFSTRLQAAAVEVGQLLDRLLSPSAPKGERARPRRLIEAMRYAVLGGGKRLRPLLALECAALFGVPRPRALMVGAAIESVHCYSLVHDDLPSMDDDAMRRGKPTVHRAYDEATAILVGDSLLTFAFGILARPDTHPDPAVRIALVGNLAGAAGVSGMTGGQMLDLAAEGRYGRIKLNEADIATLHSMKTGALIRFACEAGAILADAPKPHREAISRYGDALGQAFQIADDLLDLEGDPTTIGKTTGKDAALGKATLIACIGRDGAHAKLNALVHEAEQALAWFGPRGDILRATAHFVATRRS